MKRWSRKSRAFSLVEVTLALGVAAFCLVAIFGLLPVGLNSSRNAIEQTAANGILSAVSADLRATPATSPRGHTATSQQYQVVIPANPVTRSTVAPPLYFTSDGAFSTTAGASSRYLLSITFLKNDSAKSATLVDLTVTWPAQAAITNASGRAETLVALDRN